MNSKKSSFFVSLVIVAILVLVAALLYTLKPAQPAAVAGRSANRAVSQPARPRQAASSPQGWDSLKAQEFLGEEPASYSAVGEQALPSGFVPGLARAAAEDGATPGENARFAGAQPSALYGGRTSHPVAASAAPLQEGRYISAADREGAARLGYPAGQTLPADEEKQAAAQAAFSPYMAALTKEQAAALEKQLDGLSGRVEEAVLRALLPKSKKDANIEKYLSRSPSRQAETAQTGGQFAPVARQIAQQKAGIMQSMQQAFGPKAAQEAGQLMDAYQHELLGALNQPGQTAEQLRKQASQISRKYNEKLQKLGEKHGLERMKQEQEKKDSVFQQKLAQAYGPETAGQLGGIMEKYRQQELALAQQGLTAEEFYKQALANQRARRKEMENFLLQNGQSLKGLHRAEDEEERRAVAQALKAEEEGQTAPQAYRATDEEKAIFGNNLKQERTEKVKIAQEMYGAEGVARIREVYNRYADETEKIMNDTETSRLEKQQQLMKARQEANQALERIQNNPQMRQLREERQVASTLDRLMQDPAVAKASPEQKEAFKQAARPVLQQMYAQINDIAADPNLSDAQKQQRISEVQQQAQRQLAGQ